MEKTPYILLTNNVEYIYRDRGSVFTAQIKATDHPDAVGTCLRSVKRMFHDADHFPYAYRMGFRAITEFSSEDGEPAGSAGIPILNQLKSNNLTNVLLIVIRKFGGKKLGVAGLISAYSSAAGGVIAAAGLKETQLYYHYAVQLPYTEIKLFEYFLKKYQAVKLSSDFKEVISYEVRVPASEATEWEMALKSSRTTASSFSKRGECII